MYQFDLEVTVDRSKAERLGSSAIPNKLYFRIGEVSDLVGVKPYVLRYWESEFPDIKPSKSKSGQRLYKRRDVELLLRIKELLYEERFTINGARKRLKDFSRVDAKELHEEALHQVAHSGKEEPRQLEVFGPDESDEDALGLMEDLEGRAGKKAPTVTARDNTKTFMKIRRDLEELLEMVKT